CRALMCVCAGLARMSTGVARAKPMRALAERYGGIDARRALPVFERETLQRWFAQRARNATATRGPVTFLADSFTSYTEPEIGRAAIELLEMAGYDVQLAGDVC